MFAVCVGLLWVGIAGAQPGPPTGGLFQCAMDLGTCATDLGTCATNLGTCENKPAAPVPQTGQTSCWDTSGTGIICTGTGQDGDLRTGVVSPNPRFIDNGDGTFTDNRSGLTWLKDANCFDAQTWAQALVDANTLFNGACGLTDGSAAGDWHLPSILELISLMNFENATGKPDGNPFMDTLEEDVYWSSTTFAQATFGAWIVKFNQAFVFGLGKGAGGFVVAVRGGP